MEEDNDRLHKRVMFSLIGLVCVIASLIVGLVFPGTFWNWGLLLLALVFVFISRRFRD